ncbi:MAG TPA: nucleoside diphosphate kinase regulator [Rhodanobacteraceae bacterium]|jgi:regulator of nucleoside diphosphate kinase|nr:nucleoside diphosphate kinase regulator [Rhodanobacteraceae bacterium]
MDTLITLSRLDVERIEALLEAPALHGTPAAARLRAEFDRADIVEPGDMPNDVVSMNSSADCVDESNGKHYTLTLVYPRDADADAGRISVLAPVGSALLGLRVGQGIDWPGPGGQTHRLKVTAIHYQPEAAGDLHR